jgi:hypothetical protein
MLSSDKEAEVDGVVAEEVSVAAEEAVVAVQVPRDKLVEPNSPVVPWVLRSGLRV